MQKCEFCGGEYANVAVHQRFCKAKKEVEEKAIPASVPEGTILEDDPTPDNALADALTTAKIDVVKDAKPEKEPLPEEDIPKVDEPTQEQIDLVTETLKNSKALQESIKKPTNDDQVKAILKQELVVEFNEPKDVWEEKLLRLFDQIESGQTINIRLKESLSHEFQDRAGNYKYPSSNFITIIRDHCSEYKDRLNSVGGQTFICKIK